MDVPYLTTKQTIEVDRAMIEDYGILLTQMMENGGPVQAWTRVRCSRRAISYGCRSISHEQHSPPRHNEATSPGHPRTPSCGRIRG